MILLGNIAAEVYDKNKDLFKSRKEVAEFMHSWGLDNKVYDDMFYYTPRQAEKLKIAALKEAKRRLLEKNK